MLKAEDRMKKKKKGGGDYALCVSLQKKHGNLLGSLDRTFNEDFTVRPIYFLI